MHLHPPSLTETSNLSTYGWSPSVPAQLYAVYKPPNSRSNECLQVKYVISFIGCHRKYKHCALLAPLLVRGLLITARGALVTLYTMNGQTSPQYNTAIQCCRTVHYFLLYPCSSVVVQPSGSDCGQTEHCTLCLAIPEYSIQVGSYLSGYS